MKRTTSSTDICIFAGLPFLLITEALALNECLVLSWQRKDWGAGVCRVGSMAS